MAKEAELNVQVLECSDIITGDETKLYFYGFSNKWSSQIWVTIETSCALTFLESEVTVFFFVFFFFSQYTGSSHGWQSATDINTYCNVLCSNPYSGSDIKSVHQQHPVVGTSKILLLPDNTSAHKAKVTDFPSGVNHPDSGLSSL